MFWQWRSESEVASCRPWRMMPVIDVCASRLKHADFLLVCSDGLLASDENLCLQKEIIEKDCRCNCQRCIFIEHRNVLPYITSKLQSNQLQHRNS